MYQFIIMQSHETNCSLAWKGSTRYNMFWNLNLGCLHPVARVISYDMGFNPSTKR
jgi:hypothetical protein